MIEPILKIPLEGLSIEELMSKEWLVTNGLGGYASGTILGLNTRRFHGLFVPNLSAPRGRTMMLPCLAESIRIQNKNISLTALEFNEAKMETPGVHYLKEFHLEWQTPVWIFEIEGRILEKKIFMPYGYNTAFIFYRLIKGEPLQLNLRPYCSCRTHDSHLGYPQEWPFTVMFHGDRYEIMAFDGAPVMRLTLKPFKGMFVAEQHALKNIFYRTEFKRGLDALEDLSSPGFFSVELKENEPTCFIATTEAWDSLEEAPAEIFQREINRRKNLLSHLSEPSKDHFLITQLTLAADQFIILPGSRNEKNVLLDSSMDCVRTVIAGYHWFTDWGRDTMISLEGLTLCTGRASEAKAILKTFGHYVKNGLLPNHFPEGHREAIYNTVDATFWYFHAIDRYYQYTHDKEILESLYPTLQSIIEHHVRGTDFGIHMDPADGLIEAAAEGFQLTWMDAKVDEWVVTPRRGKPVEIQGLWFNALKLMEAWSKLLNKPEDLYSRLAQRAYESFHSRFWYEEGGYLYDVIDSDKGHDASLRPNQILTISLRYPILDKKLWKPVVDTLEKKLLTPFGLRTLESSHKDYHGRYEGSRWERDAAYHQGLVWTWLIGPFVDAWQKVYSDPEKAKQFLKPFEDHLKEAGVGTVSEIFDADPPYCPRACIAQAWSVAEVLRCFINLFDRKEDSKKTHLIQS